MTSKHTIGPSGYWTLNRIARQAVGGTLTHDFLGAMGDREAKAVDDAVSALTKVLLMQEARSDAAARARQMNAELPQATRDVLALKGMI